MRRRVIPELPGYELDHCIGRGAGATINLAFRKEDGQILAIKHVVRKDAEDDRFIEQAETEFEIGSRLKHPFLREYYEIVRIRKWLKIRDLYLIMEHVDGERLEDQRPRSLDRIVQVFLDVAAGLHAMHTAGFVHADIKPNNILLRRGGGVKIIDFGQSCPLGHQKVRVQGTPDYMAPEQVMRRALDQRTDVFNFGATMYWVVTGKWFKTMMSLAPTASKKIEVESRRGAAPPIELNPEIPLPLSKLIMECCETEREHRPRSMRDVASRLEMVQHVLMKHRPPAHERPLKVRKPL